MINDRQNQSASRAATGSLHVRRFDAPDRVLTFDRGRLEMITVGGRLIGKASYAPGWSLSQVAALPHRAGGPRGDYVGVMLSGRARLSSADQGDSDLTPGDFFAGTSEHDIGVVGYRPCEILYIAGVEAVAAQLDSRDSA